MTNNIVAQFSFNIWTPEEASRAHELGFNVGDFKEYPVVNGSTFNDEYNETLNSGILLLSQVSRLDRIINIKPYTFCRVFDKSGNTNFDEVFLIDNFNEEENNIEEHLFGYTINLMSETKLLEKIQCPNVKITHVVNEDGSLSKKTIYTYLERYMKLFVPKIKYCSDGTNWKYVPIIDFYDSTISTVEEIRFEHGDFEWDEDHQEYVLDISGWPVEEIRANSISIENYEVVSELQIADKDVWFDRIKRRFYFHGTSQAIGEGTILINYTYQKANALSQKFNVPCADLSFDAPTLRQLLTTLMQQVGCIPVVKNRKLSFIDFQKDAVKFGGNRGYYIDNTVNYIKRSLSSDSFANTLVNMSSNVLDSENSVYCEALGFRDRENALIKQTENLFLETKFPIYKVEKFVINSYVIAHNEIKRVNAYVHDTALDSDRRASWDVAITKNNNLIVFDLNLAFNEVAGSRTDFHINVDGYVCAGNSKEPGKLQKIRFNENVFAEDFTPNVDDVFRFSLEDIRSDQLYFYGTITLVDDEGLLASLGFSLFTCNFTMDQDGLFLYTEDITKLIVEKSVRQLLSNDFQDMVVQTENAANPTIDTLAKYIYGTVGYSIGSKKIEGFSEMWNRGEKTWLGWIEKEKTFIENIWNFIVNHNQQSIFNTIKNHFSDIPIIYDIRYIDGEESARYESVVNYQASNIRPFNPYYIEGGVPVLMANTILSSKINFSYLWFDIRYQPLNSFNLSYVKDEENIDYLIEQFDGNASGVTEFDRLSIHEQEQVNRIGNETLAINQRTNNFNLVQNFEQGPLYFKDDSNRDGELDSKDNGTKYIIFKRSFTINNNCFNATYFGSKDAVLKDYFTSIRTKYRAYQYVDFNDSIIRKEKDLFFIRISENDWYDGDNKLFFGNFTSVNMQESNRLPNASILLGEWKTNYADKTVVKKAVSPVSVICGSNNTQAKNDISIVSNDTFFAIIYEEYDNVSSGSYFNYNLQSLLVFSTQNMSDIASNGLGGVPQKWQIWEDDFYLSHSVSYAKELDINSIFDASFEYDSSTVTEAVEDMNKVIQLPIVDKSLFDLESLLVKKTVFSIVDDNRNLVNNKESRKRVFYKDGSEIINHTVQFYYYTDSENIIWNENFFKMNGICGKLSFYDVFVKDITGQDFSLKNDEYILNDRSSFTEQEVVTINNGATDHTAPYILVDWEKIFNEFGSENVTEIKVCVWVATQRTNMVRDILAFRYNGVLKQKFYLTINDTKSDYVLAEKNGILYRKYKVRKNTKDRLVDSLY